MKILAVANQKGGVGKTTTVFHIAHYAAEQGKRVLVVDTDEADLSEVFTASKEKGPHLYASQIYTGKVGNCKPQKVAKNISFIAADVGVLDVDDMPARVIEKPREILARFDGEFDLVLIDTPPNLQRRMIGALTAANAVVAPFNISAFSLHRLPKFITTVENVRAELNPNLRLLGLLPSLINSRSSNEMDTLPELIEAYGDLIIPQAIIARACVGTALAKGNPVWHKAWSGNQRLAAKEIKAACAEILKRLG